VRIYIELLPQRGTPSAMYKAGWITVTHKSTFTILWSSSQHEDHW